MTDRGHFPWGEAGLLAAAVLAAGALWLQGWAGRILNDLDKLPYFEAASRLWQSGSMPNHGHLLSYTAYSPPGVAFLLAPGLALFHDARLQEFPCKFALYIGTVLFVYLIGRRAIGPRAGLVAGMVTAVSQLAQQDLIGTQFFVSSSLFFLILGVQGGRKWWFAVALFDFGVGLYVHPTIAPFLLVFVVVAVLFRRSVSFRLVALALLGLLLVWLPYLLFEMPRGFLDVRSFVSLQPSTAILSGVAKAPTYCFAAAPGEEQVENGVYVAYLGRADIIKRIIYPEPTLRGEMNYWACKVLTNTVHNFDDDFFLLGANPGLNVFLWIVALAGMVGLGLASRPLSLRLPLQKVKWYWVLCLGLLGAAVLFGLFNPDWLGHLLPHHRLASGTRLALQQAHLFLPALWLAGVLGFLMTRASVPNGAGLRVVALAAWLPFLILCLINEPGRPDRFWWQWPIYALALAFAAELGGRALGGRIWAGSAVCAAVIVLVVPGPFDRARVTDWVAHGFSGQDSGQVQTVDFLGSQTREEGRSSLTVGYSLQYPVFASETTSDPLYRTGSWMDYLLLTRQRVRNLNQTVRGLSPEDEFRVVEEPGPASVAQAGGRSPWEGFCPLVSFGHYEVFDRCAVGVR